MFGSRVASLRFRYLHVRHSTFRRWPVSRAESRKRLKINSWRFGTKSSTFKLQVRHFGADIDRLNKKTSKRNHWTMSHLPTFPWNWNRNQIWIQRRMKAIPSVLNCCSNSVFTSTIPHKYWRTKIDHQINHSRKTVLYSFLIEIDVK